MHVSEDDVEGRDYPQEPFHVARVATKLHLVAPVNKKLLEHVPQRGIVFKQEYLAVGGLAFHRLLVPFGRHLFRYLPEREANGYGGTFGFLRLQLDISPERVHQSFGDVEPKATSFCLERVADARKRLENLGNIFFLYSHPGVGNGEHRLFVVTQLDVDATVQRVLHRVGYHVNQDLLQYRVIALDDIGGRQVVSELQCQSLFLRERLEHADNVFHQLNQVKPAGL